MMETIGILEAMEDQILVEALIITEMEASMMGIPGIPVAIMGGQTPVITKEGALIIMEMEDLMMEIHGILEAMGDLILAIIIITVMEDSMMETLGILGENQDLTRVLTITKVASITGMEATTGVTLGTMKDLTTVLTSMTALMGKDITLDTRRMKVQTLV